MTNAPMNNKLLNKAILVIGNDTTVIKSLIIQLAQKGADVALVCWQMQLDSVLKITESIQATGKRFLLIEQAKTGGEFSNEQIVDAITAEIGPLDAIIDMSSQTDPLSTNQPGVNPWLIKPGWAMTKTVLTASVQP